MMDAWLGISVMGGSGGMRSLTALLSMNDAVVGPIVMARKALLALVSDGDEPRTLFLRSCLEGDIVQTIKLLRAHPDLINERFPTASKGATPLIFSICSNHTELVDSLISVTNADPDAHDTIMMYTPLMWAVYLDNLDLVKLLLNAQADPFAAPDPLNKKCAANMVTTHNPQIYDYFQTRNLLSRSTLLAGDDLYYDKSSNADDSLQDDFELKLKLSTVNASSFPSTMDSPMAAGGDEDDENALMQDPQLRLEPDFDYDKLVHEQYIEFRDSDIPLLLDYFFSLRNTRQYQNNTKLSAAIVFQLLRYAHSKAESSELAEFFFSCFCARLKAVTNTTSGVINMAVVQEGNSSGGGASGGGGDIVLMSYWLSMVQFLHFFLSKGGLYRLYPTFLQDLCNILHSLNAAISTSITLRLNDMLNDCILNYTNLSVVSSTLYANDWNMFKSKGKSHPNTYDDILHMLFPPSQNDLMKPSPLRCIQVLSALDYVLKIHNVHDLLRMQTFSQVFYTTNSIIFNRIISQSKYCSRARAIQIRFNISTLEDWIRTHNFKVIMPDKIGQLDELVLGKHSLQQETSDKYKLQNILVDTPTASKNDPGHLQFYYSSLFHVATHQLKPTIEFLQLLQVVSLLDNEEVFINTINQFECLNYSQLLKVVNKLYRYEVSEAKFPKKLIALIKNLVNEQGEAQIGRMNLHYMTQHSFLLKEKNIYLSTNHVFNVALPNLTEMISSYGPGIGGARVLRSKKYQPTLPIALIDEIDEILTSNHDKLGDYDKEKRGQLEPRQLADAEDVEAGKENNITDEAHPPTSTSEFKSDQLFQSMQLPSAAAHRAWNEDDIENNPW